MFVFGGGEDIGEHVLKQLAHKGHEPVTVAETKNRAEGLKKMGAADVMITRDYNFVEAIKGSEAIIYLAEASVTSGENKNILVDHKAIIKTVEEAQQLGINRIVYLSAVLADESDESKSTGAKHEPEELIRRDGIVHTIIRTTHAEAKPGKGMVKAVREVGVNAGKKAGDLAFEDIAAVLVEALENENVFSKTFEITAGNTPIREALQAL
ncbi:NAD(P)H-binding protein [Planococcus lenghuensis]|uniref:NAD(P)H-binding protein n=1 Tax=Planococcus lenghuensis TaxID=2213202 RepID=UPI001E295AA8|nr:NAD(P)H-binding protein [Planococcus lenghuensis]